MTRVVWNAFSKSAKQKITFSPGLFSLGIRRTDLYPGKGRNISIMKKKLKSFQTKNKFEQK